MLIHVTYTTSAVSARGPVGLGATFQAGIIRCKSQTFFRICIMIKLVRNVTSSLLV